MKIKVLRNVKEICMIDPLKILSEEGIINACKLFGPVKKVDIQTNEIENQAFIEFENEYSVNDILNNKGDLPTFVSIEISNRVRANDDDNSDEISEQDDSRKTIIDTNKEINKIKIEEKNKLDPIYIGPKISMNSLIEKSKKLGLKDKIDKLYNLKNDDLFGNPVAEKWVYMKKPKFLINNLDFHHRFKNITSGKIIVVKKLSPNMFVGQIDNDELYDVLEMMSKNIECSEIINKVDWKHGMLVGAFDNFTELYCRGYITLVTKNSVNVALCDFGRVINTNEVRMVPEDFLQVPPYSFKVYAKDNIVSQLMEDELYIFKMSDVSAEKIILILYINSSKEFKVTVKNWEPTVEEYGVPYVDFKSDSLVELLKLKNMNSLLVRSREKRHMNIFFTTWNSVANYCYKNCQPMGRAPFYGEIIGYKSSNNYVRGRIRKYLGNNVYSVKLMDYPVKENVKLSELRELNYEHKIRPLSYLNIGLDNALPFPIQFDSTNFIDVVIGNTLIARFDESKTQGWKKVVLIIKSLKENVNNILYGLVEPLWLKDIPIEPIKECSDYCMYGNLIVNELKKKSVVTMTFVLFHKGIFYFRDNSFGKSFSLLCDMINEYCGVKLYPYLPHNEEVCLGKFSDGMWYRVMCDQVKPGKLTQVYSLDIGNVAFLNSTQIRKFTRELLFEPIHVYSCYLDTSEIDTSKISDKSLRLLTEIESIDCVEFTVVEKLNCTNQYVIKCPFFENMLK